MGATNGDSYFYFSVDPGVHHLCATTQFGGSPEELSTAVLHFTAEAGGVYYFEMKNLSWPGTGCARCKFSPLDSDEGKFLCIHAAAGVFTPEEMTFGFRAHGRKPRGKKSAGISRFRAKTLS